MHAVWSGLSLILMFIILVHILLAFYLDHNGAAGAMPRSISIFSHSCFRYQRHLPIYAPIVQSGQRENQNQNQEMDFAILIDLCGKHN